MSPLHPILVHFPIALFTVSFAADVLGRIRASATTDTLGFWCLALAAVGAAAAVAAGIWDMSRADLAEMTHRLVHVHRAVGLVLFTALAVLATWRWRQWRGARPEPVGWPYLLAASAVFALLAFQGWFGGQLVYGHGAGVAAAGQGMMTPEKGREGLAPFAGIIDAAHEHHDHAD